jgi:hypothetical protein
VVRNRRSEADPKCSEQWETDVDETANELVVQAGLLRALGTVAPAPLQRPQARMDTTARGSRDTNVSFWVGSTMQR